MAFGKRKSDDDGRREATTPAAAETDDDLDGPFDIDDFDDPSVATAGRLDLGSVLIPMPEAGQVSVEVSEAGVPNAVLTKICTVQAGGGNSPRKLGVGAVCNSESDAVTVYIPTA